ncbi:O-antigen ligase domain-containing protein [Magnetospirillum sp. SS-4]|uniref:O-antigen ligase domain-containing protein n=1 Tax=Magnetospirillum sp. SS-4 TaxID=2681465 RepID=UPI0013824303|nr:O-antigen ligase domain-containing protein [Magnetospirillum sp. SS-4]CAA7621949.1 conserved membrane hypothetical protein [Magnetospirillum sp. SS-4]
MDQTAVHQWTPEERLISRVLSLTWVFYALGALYVVGPVLGWVLLIMGVLKARREPERWRRVGWVVWLWVFGMLVMEVALVAGHVDFGLPTALILKSSIGWAKGWALLAVFILAASLLDIRREVLADSVAGLAKQTVLLLPIFVAAYYVGLPGRVYISPISVVGGPGPEYFAFNFFSIDPSNHQPRWHFFSPWAPAAGFIACIHAALALDCSSRRRAIWLIAAAILVALFTKSRLALVVLLVGPLIAVACFNLLRPLTAFALSALAPTVALLGPPVMEMVEDTFSAFRSARADSSRVREALARIALNRWQSEAPIFGHGVVERGPHLVEYMPIGSHHTWYGLLFVKGAVGLAALAVPLAFTVLLLLWRSQRDKTVRSALMVIMVLIFYTFGENLEILSYLFWPGLIAVGTALKRPI